MFPSELSTGPFSLLAGQRNPAWSTWVELDDNGDIANYGIQRSWVKPRYRLTYEDADELIDFAPPEEADLAELAQVFTWRQERVVAIVDMQARVVVPGPAAGVAGVAGDQAADPGVDGVGLEPLAGEGDTLLVHGGAVELHFLVREAPDYPFITSHSTEAVEQTAEQVVVVAE